MWVCSLANTIVQFRCQHTNDNKGRESVIGQKREVGGAGIPFHHYPYNGAEKTASSSGDAI